MIFPLQNQKPRKTSSFFEKKMIHKTLAIVKRTRLSLIRSINCRSFATKDSSTNSSSTSSARSAALLTAIKQIEHSFGRNSVMQLGGKTPAVAHDAISSGSLSLDLALGVGGFPRGRVVEIYGPESSGKTSLALHVIASAQKKGMSCVFIDAEHALDPKYASALGVNLDNLYVAQPDTGEQALEIADTLVRSGGMDVVVVDSVAALVPKAELEGEMGDSHMALQARLMSQALRKLTSSLSKTRTLIIFINQIRSKIGVIFGSPDVTSGGNALKFYASVRCEIRRTSVIKDKDDSERAIGSMVKVKVAKNKLAPPFRVAEFEMTYGTGISRVGEAVDLGAQFGVLTKSGAFYSIHDAQLVNTINTENTAAAAAAAAAIEATGISSSPPSSSPSSPPPIVTGKVGVGKGKKTKSSTSSTMPTTEVITSSEPSSVETPLSTQIPQGPVLTVGAPFAQGREKAKAFLTAHPVALEAVLAAIRLKMFSGATSLPHSTTQSEETLADIEHDDLIEPKF
jgi:recombination protein RecA